MRSFSTWLWDSPADDGTTARQRLAAHRKIQKERPYYNAKDVLRYCKKEHLYISFSIFAVFMCLAILLLIEAFQLGRLADSSGWFIAAIASAPLLQFIGGDVVFYKWLFKERMLDNCCQRCNYDMRFSDRCPECGVAKENGCHVKMDA